MRNPMMLAAVLPVAAALAAAGTSHAQVTLDGIADPAYGKEVIVQNTQTNFGDSNLGVVDFANGSELNGAYARIEGDFLYLLLSGNLESNFNKLEVFIDAVPGGQNQLRGDNLDVDFNGLNRMGDDNSTPKVVEGLRFDEGFEADLWVSLTCGSPGGVGFAVFMNYATLPTEGNGVGGFLGSGGAGFAGATVFESGFGFGLDNSNTAGVFGGGDIGSGAGVLTGVELQIPLAAIPGYEGGDLKISAFINGGGHDFVSNQVLGPIGGGANLGEPRLVNFADIPGEQFFVVPNGGGTKCPADLNGDNQVNGSDLTALLGAWGAANGSNADLNGDGQVNGSDLTALLGAWGSC